MSCTPTPTATLFGTLTSFTPSTSFSQSAANNAQLTTVVQQTCVASGTISGSSVGCLSSAPVTEVNTVGGGGQAAQVPIVISVPITEAQPTQTLFAPCTDGGASSSSSSQSSQLSIGTPLTTSVFVQSTFPPTTVVETSSATLADGSVVQTAVTVVTTLPPTSLYVPTSFAGPTLQSSSSRGSGTKVAPIVGGVLGGFFGLIVVVGSLWWLCRRRRLWDDIFEKEELQNEDAQASATSARRLRRRVDSSAQPRPYQYGLVGRVVPPGAACEPLRMSQYSTVSEHSGAHSRNTSLSATPLLQNAHAGPSRPSTAGSIPPQPGPRVLNPVGSTEKESRSLSMASHGGSTRPLLGSQSNPASFSTWTPNMDELAVLEPPNRSGSPVLSTERLVLQVVNDGPPSPTDAMMPGSRQSSSGHSPGVIMHTDGGRVPENSITGHDTNPPPYSR